MTLVWIKQIWLLLVCGEDNVVLQQKLDAPASNIKNGNDPINIRPDTYLKYVGKLNVLFVVWFNIKEN